MEIIKFFKRQSGIFYFVLVLMVFANLSCIYWGDWDTTQWILYAIMNGYYILLLNYYRKD